MLKMQAYPLLRLKEITNMRGSSSFVRSVSQVKRNVMTAFVSPVASSILFSVRKVHEAITETRDGVIDSYNAGNMGKVENVT
ncbi:hypothetical protein F2Q69_00016018 [Brassica cretica]|uniref:Uncharacterized protein n=1 Tax=Brassica cretica TaxID=69181 RepID=A0A8S9R4Q3_BRACR|nr:hypothetical protein F2Q69_00016018 [Brassica cretica]